VLHGPASLHSMMRYCQPNNRDLDLIMGESISYFSFYPQYEVFDIEPCREAQRRPPCCTCRQFQHSRHVHHFYKHQRSLLSSLGTTPTPRQTSWQKRRQESSCYGWKEKCREEGKKSTVHCATFNASVFTSTANLFFVYGTFLEVVGDI
jgi:hypothetical protein